MRMKITETDDKNTDFCLLDDGSVFRSGEGLFVKIIPQTEDGANAVNLRTWGLTNFRAFARVVPVEAELRVGGAE